MSEQRLRISIIVLLMAVAVASFGCGGGSSANSVTGGDFITAVVPDSGLSSGSESSSSGSESENANLGDPPLNGDGDRGSGSTTVSTPAGGGNTPAILRQNVQTKQQVDYSKIPEGHIALPPGHGLDPGQIRMLYGFSEQRGNIIASCPRDKFGWCTIDVGEDGFATYNGIIDKSVHERVPSLEPEIIPLPQPDEAAQAPVIDFVSTLHVGSNVAPGADELTSGVDRNGVSVSYGEVQDGIGAAKVLEFMEQHVAKPDSNLPPGLETFSEPPTIRLAEGTSDLYARFTARAVQLINSALPYEKRITLSAETLPTDTALGDIPEGEIFLNFGSLASRALGSTRLLSNYLVDSQTNEPEEAQSASKASIAINEELMRAAFQYNPELEREYLGLKWEQTKVDNRKVENSDTLIKWFNDRIFLSVVVHELIHALGLYHIDESRFSESIMRSTITRGSIDVYTPYLENASIFFFLGVVCNFDQDTTVQPPDTTVQPPDTTVQPSDTADQSAIGEKQGHLKTPQAGTVPGHILSPLDRAALLAAYGSGRLDPGAQPDELTAENLGAWTDTSFHLRGDVDFPGGGASFGVASANGLAQAWAKGPTPWTNLEDNTVLSGSAAWNGALLGVTSSSETVEGAARLSVNLTSLRGRIDFTGMEKWGVKEAPGAVGSGTMWDDGDLGYTIKVSGNTFIQTGGDDGKVTGAFFGAAHEAMGGVLERSDLAAGFGGKR